MSNKPKLKNINVKNFSGVEKVPGIGAGWESWIRSLEDEMENEAEFGDAKWTESLKMKCISHFLEGEAKEWFLNNRDGWRSSISYDDFKQNFKWHFGSKLTRAQIYQLIARKKKKNDQSYADFITVLNGYAAILPGGIKDNTDLVLDAFCRNANPKYADVLVTQYLEWNEYQQNLEAALSPLTKLSGDGVNKSSTQVPTNGETKKGRTCYICNSVDHIAAYHKNEIKEKGKKSGDVNLTEEEKEGKEGAVNLVMEDNLDQVGMW